MGNQRISYAQAEGSGIVTSIAGCLPRAPPGTNADTMGKPQKSTRPTDARSRQVTVFSRFLKMSRIDRSLSIKELSARSGVSIPYIADLESGKLRAPSRETLSKLCKGLGLEPLETEILNVIASHVVDPFPPGLDVDVRESLLFQTRESVKEVYLVAEDFLELKDQEYMEIVTNNIKRGTHYFYFLHNREKFVPLRHELENRLGEGDTRRFVTCISASSYFLFHPGIALMRVGSPERSLGLYAKWFRGQPFRVYRMGDQLADQAYDILRTVTNTLVHTPAYRSDHIGPVRLEFPSR